MSEVLLYPRTFSTDLDNLICESQGGEKGKWDANGGRRSSIPRMQRIGITGLLTKYNDLKYLPARLCLLSTPRQNYHYASSEFNRLTL